VVWCASDFHSAVSPVYVPALCTQRLGSGIIALILNRKDCSDPGAPTVLDAACQRSRKIMYFFFAYNVQKVVAPSVGVVENNTALSNFNSPR